MVLAVVAAANWSALGSTRSTAGHAEASPSASPTFAPSPTAAPTSVAAGPGQRAGEVLVYDPENHGVILFGGATSIHQPDGTNTAVSLGDTWLWDGKRWQQLDVAGPPARSAAMAAYDSARHVIVLFGGSGPGGIGPGLYFNDTWTWDGTQWQQQFPAHSPNPRMRAGIAFDERHGVTVMFGGEGETTYTATWTWDGTDWTMQDPAAIPPARHFATMAYDVARGVTVLFGGSMGGVRLNDTWTWDGTNWTKRSAPAPQPSGWSSLAYDGATKEVVAYVYHAVDGDPLAEYTISWNGTRWTDRTTGQDPTPRAETRMAYDPDTKQVLMYGPTSETWIWDGRTWSLWQPAAGE